MTTTLSAPARRPPLVRPRSGRAIAGVAAGTAAHLRQDPLVVRVAFAILATTGIGIVAYGLLWLTMPVAAPGDESAEAPPLPGWRPAGAKQWIATVVLGLVAASLLGQLTRWSSSDVVLPLVLVGAGLAVIWRQLDTDRTLAVAGTRWTLAGGVVLAGAGLVFLLATTGQLANARNGFAATLVLLTGLLLATAPLWRRLLDSRDEERAARIRSEERAAVAAHLHDSVLQTLALIQRHAEDQQAVSRLARSQERELRAWLYDPKVVREGGTWAGLVAGMVAEVEADHALVVDHVVVGDAPVDDALAALGAATREALVNVAKHSGVTTADLYTEVTPTRVSVFVRDRGAGFDADAVPADRRGLRDSVTGRITRLGGTAQIRSAPGEGTEVELDLPRVAAA
ncbi:PspC domain-containing protein [Blastococcus sp. TML/M2B]|uniref:ATP-binding protein n=1 Tax=unclassified Blastococcus TaxID=2619396 RepID=UPI00190C4877|nr:MULTISPECIES: ATP-binding protein [unclassified Blastococcus]MBN1093920.1 PspC domain-containing protein [Blastococcus sp. TML/M2B]MBN1095961.1 PspC domain-containing protein [Blastococcus sp. TML/C7B]